MFVEGEAWEEIEGRRAMGCCCWGEAATRFGGRCVEFVCDGCPEQLAEPEPFELVGSRLMPAFEPW